MTKYKNPWHRTTGRNADDYGPEFFETDAKPVAYRGYQIYRRLPQTFDVVRDGCAVGQYAGINGARRFIDALLTEGGRGRA